MKLREIAEIKSGYLFRFRLRSDKDGAVKVIQLKDVNEDGYLNIDGIYSVDFTPSKRTEFLQKGDVLFKAKSNKHVAAVFDSDMENVIATVHYFILRIKNISILPEFLRWYLNEKPAQKYFDFNAAGTRIPIINKKALEKLEIPGVSLEKQKKVVAVYELLRREQVLMDNIKDKREKLVSWLLIDSIKNINTGG